MVLISKISICPVRIEPSDKSEMITQLLFGELCQLRDRKDNWFFISTIYDEYEGWIDAKQVTEISQNVNNQHICFQLTHSCHQQDNHIPIVLGSSLPNFDGLNFKINKEKFIYNGKSLEISEKNKTNIKKIALKYLNAPYLWGGRSPFGIDCSGLTQMVYKFLNIPLPRDAYQQAEMGEIINFTSEAKMGDLAFFGNEESITHVGIVLDDNKIIHAHGWVRIDILDHIGIFNVDTKKYSHKLKVIKRILD
jgi:hypothetical protein